MGHLAFASAIEAIIRVLLGREKKLSQRDDVSAAADLLARPQPTHRRTLRQAGHQCAESRVTEQVCPPFRSQ